MMDGFEFISRQAAEAVTREIGEDRQTFFALVTVYVDAHGALVRYSLGGNLPDNSAAEILRQIVAKIDAGEIERFR